MKAGFIGTGQIGQPMAKRLIEAGHDLVVHDLREQACADLLELGATWADSPATVAKQCPIVFTSLPGPPEVESVALGKYGILAGALPDLIHVDLSSNSPSAIRRLAALEAERGVTLLDAPVSGGVGGAREGTLAVMVGGDQRAFETVKPLLEAFGQNIFYVGESGRGSLVKLMNNTIVLGAGLLLQEVLALGVKANFDPMQLYEIWNVSSSARQVQGLPRLLERDWEEPTFSLALAAKDIGLCLEAARELQVPMTVGSAVGQVFTRSLVHGLGAKGLQATLVTIEEEAGVRVAKKGPPAAAPRAGRRTDSAGRPRTGRAASGKDAAR